MADVKLDIEVYPWFGEKGVLCSLWIGEASEPVYEGYTTYKELVMQNLEAYTFGGMIPESHFDEVEEFVRVLEKTAKYARKQMEKMKEDV